MNLISRRLPTYASRCRPNLAALKTSLQLLNQIGTPVPGVQAAVGTVLQIIQYAEAVKQNRNDARDLAISAAQIAHALLQATGGLGTDEIDDAFREDVADFHDELLRISTTMQHLVQRDVWRRLLNRDGHATTIAEHRRNLAHAVTVFQIKDGITSRRLMVRQQRELRDSLGSLSTMVAERYSSPPTPASTAPLSLSPIVYRRDDKLQPSSRLHVEVDISAAMTAITNAASYFFFYPHRVNSQCRTIFPIWRRE
ncbi:hypothetical protein GY45DRAFT_1328417 [Cubamyces sp. BRFM 1775]|nr:hypothetical protein GY45DRAFT_1328417 [Cubamyces sp. BRFM 1775]